MPSLMSGHTNPVFVTGVFTFSHGVFTSFECSHYYDF